MKWVRNVGEKPPRSRNDRSVSSAVVTGRVAQQPLAIRWKRGISVSIRRYDGRTALRQEGNRPDRPSAPAYSRPSLVVAHRHRHLGVLGRHAELVEEPQQVGVGALVVHDEAGVDGADLGPSTTWVSAWPPSRVSASKSVTWDSRPSTWAAVQPGDSAAHDGDAVGASRGHASALPRSKSAIGSRGGLPSSRRRARR